MSIISYITKLEDTMKCLFNCNKLNVWTPPNGMGVRNEVMLAAVTLCFLVEFDINKGIVL